MSSRPLNRALLLSPALVLMAVCVVLPVLLNLVLSFQQAGQYGLANYQAFARRGQYLAALANTLSLAALVAVIVLAAAFPACLFFSRRGPVAAGLFLGALALSFAVSGLIRTLSWQLILSRSGALNALLHGLGVGNGQAEILYTRTAVLIGTVQIMLPYGAAILFAGMRRVDQDFVFAAQTLGAARWHVAIDVWWPQLRGSIASALLVVFVLSTGFFVTPALLGGPGETLLGNVMLSDLVFNFDQGGALAATSGVVMTAVLGLATTMALLLAGRPYHRRARAR